MIRMEVHLGEQRGENFEQVVRVETAKEAAGKRGLSGVRDTHSAVVDRN